ncbi:hypothetical protein O6H91_06G088600 [Diphasiastrum complanatum]|uniref:Uncharacterized protein n=1 Tax=Diphasiastrum complanatum TaxID=34168 RepID=A0ACC2DG08_DIPCM|nr:hypothetical protein O6H91_06G088600 [Diphasiastrum complanatum]
MLEPCTDRVVGSESWLKVSVLKTQKNDYYASKNYVRSNETKQEASLERKMAFTRTGVDKATNDLEVRRSISDLVQATSKRGSLLSSTRASNSIESNRRATVLTELDQSRAAAGTSTRARFKSPMSGYLSESTGLQKKGYMKYVRSAPPSHLLPTIGKRASQVSVSATLESELPPRCLKARSLTTSPEQYERDLLDQNLDHETRIFQSSMASSSSKDRPKRKIRTPADIHLHLPDPDANTIFLPEKINRRNFKGKVMYSVTDSEHLPKLSSGVDDIGCERHDSLVSIVHTPRVPGDQAWRRDAININEDSLPPKETLSKEGLSINVPYYLLKLTGASREGMRAMPHLKPPVLINEMPSKCHGKRKTKSTKLRIVTVPVSAKQWLLQSIGLKDEEINELFDQIECVPQFAAEYVREIKAEWEAMVARESKIPPEADFLMKDRALLGKVRELMLRFVEVTKGAEVQVGLDNGGVHRGPHKNLNKDYELFQKATVNSNGKVDCVTSEEKKIANKSSQELESQSIHPEGASPLGLESKISVEDVGSAVKSFICSECGQLRPNLTETSLQQNYLSEEIKKPEIHASYEKHTFPSLIPAEDYIINKYIVQPTLLGKSECKSTYSPFDKRWYTVLFPALQPGKREDVQLLGHWLQHAIQRNSCENPDGRFKDVESAFVLHSIAFLEIVRQVDIHCEERGNLLLHLWRQLLRIFNQVMVRAEPKLNATEDELRRVRNTLEVEREKLASIMSELKTSEAQCVLVKEQLKQKDLETLKFKRCHLCRAENMTPRSREMLIRRSKHRAFLYRESTAKLVIEDKIDEVPSIMEKPPDENSSTLVSNQALENHSALDSGPAPESDNVLAQSSESFLSQVDAEVQTEDMQPERLQRCRSAPPNLFPMIKVCAGEEKINFDFAISSQLQPAEISDEEAKALENIATNEPALVQKQTPQGGLLKSFENLAVDTIDLLQRIPVTEGALASSIRNLLKQYTSLTGLLVGKSQENERGGTCEEIENASHDESPNRDESASHDEAMNASEDPNCEEILDSSQDLSRPKKGKKPKVRTQKPSAETDLKPPNKTGGSVQPKSTVPLGFSKLMKIYSPPKNVKFFNARQIRLFSRFVAMDQDRFYPEPGLYLYLKLLQKASSKVGALLPSDQDDGVVFMNPSHTTFISDEPNLVAYFGTQAAAISFIEKVIAKHAFTERASPEIRKLVKESEVRKLDWDLLMEAILEVHPDKLETIEVQRKKINQEMMPVPKEKEEELENLFTAGDANQDGVLTFSEFREIIGSADPSISAQNALRMFRETLLVMSDGGDSISPTAFARIAHSHGISASHDVVFNLLGKTWLQVQGDINEEKVKENPKEFDRIKSTLSALMEERSNENLAVQTFRMFVLQFCGGDEEEDDDDEEEAETEPVPETSTSDVVTDLG